MGSDQFFNVAGLRLRYIRHGKGPLCICPSPGWGIGVDLYPKGLKPLTDMFSLAYIDTRGSGRSERPASTQHYRYELFAREIEALRKQLGAERAWLIGHSLGGVLAMRYALDFPQRIAGLILVGTFAKMDTRHNREVEARKKSRSHERWYPLVSAHNTGWEEVKTDNELKRKTLAIMPLYFKDHSIYQRHKADFAKPEYRGHAWQGWGRSEGFSANILSELKNIRCPTLVIVGDADFVCPPLDSERISKAIRGSKLEVIKNAGHFPWIEKPARFFRLIKQFVREQERYPSN